MALSIITHGVYGAESQGNFTVVLVMQGGDGVNAHMEVTLSDLVAVYNSHADIRYRMGDVSMTFILKENDGALVEVEFGWQPNECKNIVLMKKIGKI